MSVTFANNNSNPNVSSDNYGLNSNVLCCCLYKKDRVVDRCVKKRRSRKCHEGCKCHRCRHSHGSSSSYSSSGYTTYSSTSSVYSSEHPSHHTR